MGTPVQESLLENYQSITVGKFISREVIRFLIMTKVFVKCVKKLTKKKDSLGGCPGTSSALSGGWELN